MTKEEWLLILEKNFGAAKSAFVLQVQSMNRSNFLAEASIAWDRARAKYGPEFHIGNPIQEAGKEAHDGVEYRCKALFDQQQQGK